VINISGKDNITFSWVQCMILEIQAPREIKAPDIFKICVLSHMGPYNCFRNMSMYEHISFNKTYHPQIVQEGLPHHRLYGKTDHATAISVFPEGLPRWSTEIPLR
jgi:hypothetical protein